MSKLRGARRLRRVIPRDNAETGCHAQRTAAEFTHSMQGVLVDRTSVQIPAYVPCLQQLHRNVKLYA
ncbi:hypothetical protein BRCON_2250 [Candidatus Sumerlaea chitinivorans]|uniref:Uncharacterized protein n=1 Tax=Sumerlaea chitinivorans TaxID=2250252 RepID=A0A2Z4Y710_SUMC1|nr:hypothetical protein BRCON_2250 [Candidatus Sumerlaea chitinivorans]